MSSFRDTIRESIQKDLSEDFSHPMWSALINEIAIESELHPDEDRDEIINVLVERIFNT